MIEQILLTLDEATRTLEILRSDMSDKIAWGKTYDVWHTSVGLEDDQERCVLHNEDKYTLKWGYIVDLDGRRLFTLYDSSTNCANSLYRDELINVMEKYIKYLKSVSPAKKMTDMEAANAEIERLSFLLKKHNIKF